jgi:DNA-binding response OmpR family regulator
MSKRILSVSYDVSLLATRKMLLEQKGYAVENALGFSKALAFCRAGAFDLFILGHSIPYDDKLALIESFRAHCPLQLFLLSDTAKTLCHATITHRRMTRESF